MDTSNFYIVLPLECTNRRFLRTKSTILPSPYTTSRDIVRCGCRLEKSDVIVVARLGIKDVKRRGMDDVDELPGRVSEKWWATLYSDIPKIMEYYRFKSWT